MAVHLGSVLLLLATSSSLTSATANDVVVMSRLFSNPQHLLERGSTAPNVNTSCVEHIHNYTEALKRTELWALQMMDASTKIPEGVLFGNIVHLGNFDECLMVKHDSFYGEHCLVTIMLNKEIGNNSVEKAWQEVERISDIDIIVSLGRLSKKLSGLHLQMALCVPSTCSAEDLQSMLQYAVSRLIRNITITVDPDQCHVNRMLRLRFIDWFAVVFLLVFIFVAIVSTLYDIQARHSGFEPKPLLVSFSLYTNFCRLMSISSNSSNLQALHGIRFLSMAWVVLGHRYLINSGLPAMNLLYLNEFKRDWRRLIIMNGTLSVDTFFLLSGLLMSFVLLKEVEKRGKFDVLLFYIHRYIRLTPALAVMILLTVTLLNYSGEGPLWDSRYRATRESCERNWWTNLLYINNYYDSSHMCLGQTWYLAVDMQLHWLSPIVLVPLWKKPQLAHIIILIFIGVGWSVAFAVPYSQKYYAGVWTGPQDKWPLSQQNQYYPTHTRFVPWLIGIYLGHYLHVARKKKLRFSKNMVRVGWLFATFLMLGTIHLAYPFQQPSYVYDRIESSLFLSLFRPAWALGLAWIIIACDLGHGGVAHTILSWNIFQPLGRLSYGIYLTHISVLIALSSCLKTPIYLHDVITIPQFLGDLMISIGWTIPLTLLFESPIIVFEKCLLGNRGSDVQGNIPATSPPVAP